MHELCRTLRDHLADLHPREAKAPAGADLRNHLKSCPHCQAQWRTHETLGQALTGLTVPQPQREEELLRRLSPSQRPDRSAQVPETPQPAPSWAGRLILAAYWLAAAALSAWLLLSFASSAAAWAADRMAWVIGLTVPAGVLMMVFLPYLRESLGRLFFALTATPERMAR
ncbi:MAG TPA: hypothetical protein VLV83_08270 [Acidobacteriota bacterium]|nr:hypothetical protein [Acidobacteriota bacterium]